MALIRSRMELGVRARLRLKQLPCWRRAMQEQWQPLLFLEMRQLGRQSVLILKRNLLLWGFFAED